MKEEELSVLEFYQLLILRVAYRYAFRQNRTHDSQLCIEGFSENNRVCEVLVMDPIFVICIVANMLSQEENASAQ